MYVVLPTAVHTRQYSLTFIPFLHHRQELGVPSPRSEELLAGCAALSGSLETLQQGEEDSSVAGVAVQAMQLSNCRD